MRAHETFEFTRPDEVAECWDGVGDDLYKALWGLMKLVPKIPQEIMEDSGPADHVGHGNLAAMWGHLSPEHQEALNKLAIKEAAQWAL